MRCERARELLSPYLDGELSEDERREVAAHIEGCRACSAQAADFRRIGRTLAESGREPAPRDLALRVRASLARETATESRPDTPSPVTSPVVTTPHRLAFAARALMRQAAVIVAACLLSALATWWVIESTGETSRLQQDVLAAHMRALLQDNPIQVASSDAHMVKPWFAGRIDFAPEVKDLAADGFPLLGGRLDYVNGRRVAAIVYGRRLHTISVFVWPSAHTDFAPRFAVRNGYNLATWTRQGLAYWAVSDVSAGDLAQLAGRL